MVSAGKRREVPLRLGLLGALIFLLPPSAIVLAQRATPNIVTLSFTDAVMQTNEAKKDFAALQAKFAPRQAQLEKLNDDVESLRKQLGDGADKLTDPERNSRMQTLSAKEKQLQRAEEDLRNDSQSEGQEAFQQVARKVYAFLQDYAKQQGYAAVIERGTDAAPVVWYAAQNVDITSSLTQAYNLKSGAAPPEPAGARPPNAPAPAKPRP